MSYPRGPVLAVWVDSKELDAIDDMGPPAICQQFRGARQA